MSQTPTACRDLLGQPASVCAWWCRWRGG